MGSTPTSGTARMQGGIEMLTPCPECGNLCAQDAVACPRCGKSYPAQSVPDEEQFAAEEEKQSELRPQRGSDWQNWLILCLFIIVVAGWLLGHYHVVQSDDGTRLVPKVHWTLSETFVDIDAITGQPAITASARYPLTIKALQRDGILESDEAREERLRQETKAEMERIRRESEEEAARYMRDAQRQIGQ